MPRPGLRAPAPFRMGRATRDVRARLGLGFGGLRLGIFGAGPSKKAWARLGLGSAWARAFG
jgi:hypothetical protein